MLGQGSIAFDKTLHRARTAQHVGEAVDISNASQGGYRWLTLQVSGDGAGTITWQGTVDGSNWENMQATALSTGTAATTTTANGLFRADVAGLKGFRANITTYTSGAFTVKGRLVAQ